MGDEFKRLNKLRNKVIRKKNNKLELLLASFVGTKQQKDIENRTPLIQDYFRVKINVKAFSETEMQKVKKHAINFSDNVAVFGALAEEFDMPLWAFYSLKKRAPLKDYANTFIYQTKACNLYCPWCYVDDSNKNAKKENGKYFSIKKIVDVFEKERKNQILLNFRPSGGEPSLVPEQWLLALRELEKRGLRDEIFVQGDNNLTTGYFIKYLEEKEEIEKNLLEKIGEYENFGLLCSFKGTDPVSFSKATGAKPELHEIQFDTFYILTKAGINTYPFIYDPNPNTLEEFMEKAAKKFGDVFYLKTSIFRLKLYGPEKNRLKHQGISIKDYQKQLDENFRKSKEIMQDLIWKKFGLNYQAIPRPGLKFYLK